MSVTLKGLRVAALVTDGFEESELQAPRTELERAGATVDIVAPDGPSVRSWSGKSWGHDVKVDHTLDDARPEQYDALLLPGGVMNPDRLRTDERAVAFVREAYTTGKPIAAICHGPWTLIEAGVVDGLRLTSWPSLKTDLSNAGATWVDEPVVVDRGIVTSRKPDDLPDFNKAVVETFAAGRHERPGQVAEAVS